MDGSDGFFRIGVIYKAVKLYKQICMVNKNWKASLLYSHNARLGRILVELPKSFLTGIDYWGVNW